jgi:hypothetical protein
MSANESGPSNGFGSAAILAAGIGVFVLAVLAIAADKAASLKQLMVFYKPTGPLSGVTTTAILVWLVVWAILNARWRGRRVSARQHCRFYPSGPELAAYLPTIRRSFLSSAQGAFLRAMNHVRGEGHAHHRGGRVGRVIL